MQLVTGTRGPFRTSDHARGCRVAARHCGYSPLSRTDDQMNPYNAARRHREMSRCQLALCATSKFTELLIMRKRSFASSYCNLLFIGLHLIRCLSTNASPRTTANFESSIIAPNRGEQTTSNPWIQVPHCCLRVSPQPRACVHSTGQRHECCRSRSRSAFASAYHQPDAHLAD